jgi:UDP-N-acetylmuramoylalanine--D-glutamate ligase
MYTTKLDPAEISALTDRLLIARSNNLKQILEIEHRLETVSMKDGVEFLNDSKATEPTSTLYSLSCMDKPVVWLLSCVLGFEDLSELRGMVSGKVKAIFYMGDTNDLLVEDFVTEVEYANEGETILFSPATPSSELFGNYRKRGEEFRKCVMAL